MIDRICGTYLVLVALAVGLHTILESPYHTYDSAALYGTIWDILDWFMAVAFLLLLGFGYQLKRSLSDKDDTSSVSREYVTANTLFYGSLYFAILFFWNWFMHLNPAAVMPDGGIVRLIWLVVDPGLVLLAGAMGIHLLRDTVTQTTEEN